MEHGYRGGFCEVKCSEGLQKAVEEFNRYRSPEATARLTSCDATSFTVEVTGPFCATCGFYDYFDDLKILLENFGVKSRIVEVKETDNGGIVKYETTSHLPEEYEQ